MTKEIEFVLARALQLPRAARAELVSELLVGLDGPTDPDAQGAWELEIQRRIAAIDAGTMALEPWSRVKRRIEGASL